MRDQVFPFMRFWPDRCSDVSSDLLYDTPDRLLTLLQLSPHTMISGYQKLLQSSMPIRPFWSLDYEQPPEVEPLSGLIICKILDEFPELLDVYQAVDRCGGRDGDGHYLERLSRSTRSECLFQSFHSVGELRRELDEQLQLVQLQRQQLDGYLKLQQRSQRLFDDIFKRMRSG